MTPDQLAKQFGAAVKLRRNRLQLTAATVGHRVGLSAREIFRIESGRVRTEMLFKLADALEVNLSTLVREAEGS